MASKAISRQVADKLIGDCPNLGALEAEIIRQKAVSSTAPLNCKSTLGGRDVTARRLGSVEELLAFALDNAGPDRLPARDNPPSMPLQLASYVKTIEREGQCPATWTEGSVYVAKVSNGEDVYPGSAVQQGASYQDNLLVRNATRERQLPKTPSSHDCALVGLLRRLPEEEGTTVEFCVVSFVLDEETLLAFGGAICVCLYFESLIIGAIWNKELCINGRGVALTVNGRFTSEDAKAAGTLTRMPA